MKKRLFLIIIMCCLFLSGCTASNNVEYYQKVSKIIVNTLTDPNVDLSDVNKKDIDVVKDTLSKITHKNQEINISELIEKDTEHKVTEPNTKEIYHKDGNCYIKYDDLKINVYDEENFEIDPFQRIICDGYYVTVYQSDFFPNYEKAISNPLYSYLYKGFINTNNDYKFIYKSTYDGSYLNININADKKINKINIIFNENYNNIEFDDAINSSIGLYLPFIIMLALTILILLVLLKKKNKI